MCVLAFAWRAHPRWQLVLAGNRDELHARPAAPLARWADAPHVIAGRDLAAGGTWMGVAESANGPRVAVVTNLRGFGPPDPALASRGALVADLLRGKGEYADPDSAELMRFNPLSLILIEGARARFLTNRPEPLRTDLAPGLYGLSNGPLDAPWPKTLQLKSQLLAWLATGADDPRELFAVLRDETLPAGEATDLPQAPSSPVFINHPVYGTRCSTVVAIDIDGNGTIDERRYASAGSGDGETSITIGKHG